MLAPKLHPGSITFYINNDAHPISTVQEEKDLGVTFDEDLNFKAHINQIIHKANNVLGTIKRNFNSRDPVVIRLLYTTLVRPILDMLLCHMESLKHL